VESQDNKTRTSTTTQSFSSGPTPDAFVGWLWHAIMGVFAMGFLAWAALVWNATDLVKQQQADMRSMKERVERMQHDLNLVSETARQAGAIHARMDQQIADLQRRLNKIEEGKP
jgi:uncharacterized membrane protein YdfJ with MMPL/SSD domain